MEQGIYGFPPGKNITVDIQEFDSTGVWNKPLNSKICFIEATGGGAGGGGSSGAGVGGGSAGSAFQIFIMASRLAQQETVTVGAGGAGGVAGTGSDGGNTIFAGITWVGGRNSTSVRNPYLGVGAASSWGSPGTAAANGHHGGFGAGGGGGGGGLNAAGRAGGSPRTFDFGTGQLPNTAGGAAGGTSGSLPGANADPLKDRHGFGEGGGGGYGTAGGTGGNGRRGSGGGGGGNGTNNGGNGGDGFIRIMTYSWE